MENTLSLPEQLMLLCLNDETGRSDEPYMLQGLEGAVLAELMLQGRLGLEEEKRLVVLDPNPTGDALLDQALNRIAEQRKPRHIGEWIGKLVPNNFFPSEPVLKATLAQRLVERGILTRVDGKLLWAIPDPTNASYPTQNPTPEQHLREQLRSALLGDGPVEERLVVLAALLQGAEALDRVLSDGERGQADARIQELCRAAAAGEGGKSAVSHAVAGERMRDQYATYSAIFDVVAVTCAFFGASSN